MFKRINRDQKGDTGNRARRRHHWQQQQQQQQRREPPRIYVYLWEKWIKQANNDASESSTSTDFFVDWNKVKNKILKNPSITHYTDTDRDGLLLLHLICAICCNFRKTNPQQLFLVSNIIDIIISYNPYAIKHQTYTAGLLPLHVACGRNAPPEIIEKLISYDSSALSLQDNDGYTPLHWSCREHVHIDVMKKLLMADHTVARTSILLIVDTNGRSNDPRNEVEGGSSSSSKRTKNVSSLSILLDAHGRNNDQNYNENWKKCQYIMCTAYYGKVVVSARSNHNSLVSTTLHASLALKSSSSSLSQKHQYDVPNKIIQMCMEKYSRNTSAIKDVYGNLPIHYACKTQTNTLCGRNDGDNKELEHGTMGRSLIKRLIKHFPQGASCVDANGYLPLHLALKYGKRTWTYGGISYLVEECPLAVSIPIKDHSNSSDTSNGNNSISSGNNDQNNFTNGFHPCFLAATYVDDIETIFCLLIRYPQIVQQGVSAGGIILTE